MGVLLKLLGFVQENKVWVALAGGVVVGLLLGLAVGWWLWPINIERAAPAHLRTDFQNYYLLWVAREYQTTGDLELARDKLGVDSGLWDEEELLATLASLSAEVAGEQATNVELLREALAGTEPPEDGEGAEDEGGGIRLQSIAMVCGVGLLILALIGGAILLMMRLRGGGEEQAGPGPAEGVAPAERPAREEGVEGAPLTQYVTTYNLGDDHYDPSFAIELENGDFMGECGVGISETIGVGSPNKVTAFEVWLFDKNDIRTVTKVLMSEYAYQDDALRAKLAPKGEPVLAEVGKELVLETKTIRVRARIEEADYGSGNLPPNSFFEKLTVDLAAWVLPEEV